MRKQLKNLLEKVNRTITDRMYEAAKEGQNHLLALVDITDDIQVDVEITGYDAQVCVFNRRDLEHYYPNIEAEIIDSLPLWNEISLTQYSTF